MTRNTLFFLAGWFAVGIGYEMAPIWGNVFGVASFLILSFCFRKKSN